MFTSKQPQPYSLPIATTPGARRGQDLAHGYARRYMPKRDESSNRDPANRRPLVEGFAKGQMFVGSARKVPEAYPDRRALEATLVLKEFLDMTGRMGYQAKMERKECKERKERKESKESKERREHREHREHREIGGFKENQESQAGWVHLVKMVYGVLQAKKVTKASRADQDAEAHRVIGEYLEKKAVGEREDHLEKEGARERADHLG
ncbi:hypothetical protein FJTKL_06138 [Diaporthe vaccinii]|uniref:Uncharacterized protein n=1 Tax=Diaporthe vaccinii TaxID=105482 RepID=A0ABR4EXE7_9PEZI